MTTSRPLERCPAASAAAAASANASTVRGTTHDGDTSRSRSATSPTGAATTGSPTAIASFTTLGEPSWNDGRSSTSAAFIARTRSTCGRPCTASSRTSIARAASARHVASASGQFLRSSDSRDSCTNRDRSTPFGITCTPGTPAITRRISSLLTITAFARRAAWSESGIRARLMSESRPSAAGRPSRSSPQKLTTRGSLTRSAAAPERP